MNRNRKNKNKRKIKDTITSALDIPKELVTDIPKLVFESNTNVYIENYKGIIEYTDCLIKISAGKYDIVINGCSLNLTFITAEELSVAGNISSVQFC